MVGVHTPEFPFERDVDNVRAAVEAMDVDYPVALDPGYAVWQAFANHYWPAMYLADAEGRIRYHHFGEGGVRGSERAIQRLLREAGAGGIADDLVSIGPGGVEAQADWATLESPETYLGYEQARSFAVPGGVRPDQPRTYAVPGELQPQPLGARRGLDDRRRGERAQPAGGGIAFRFHARDVNLVIRSRDGAPIPSACRGRRAARRCARARRRRRWPRTLLEPRLYQLVRQPGRILDRTFEIAFDAPGVEAYVFTFG